MTSNIELSAANSAKDKVLSFLNSEEPQVLAIFGEWGAGKTWMWHEALKESKNSNEISNKFTHYSYISLFGATNTADMEERMVQNTIEIKKLPAEGLNIKGISELKTGWNKTLETLIDLDHKVLTKIPLPKIGKIFGHGKDLRLFYSSLTRKKNQIICIDDFERKSKSLDITAVMGFISECCVEYSSKVILIFNYNKFDDAFKSEFNQFREKVVNWDIEYSMNVEEAIRIGLKTESKEYATLYECCKQLNLKNIRVLRKIQIAIDEIGTYLEKAEHLALRRQISTSIVFLAYVFFMFDEKFSWEELSGSYQVFLSKTPNPAFSLDSRLKKLFEKQPIIAFDEISEMIYSLFEQGHLNHEQFMKNISELNYIAIQREKSREIIELSNLVDYSFTEPYEISLLKLEAKTKEHAYYINAEALKEAAKRLDKIEGDLRPYGNHQRALDLLQYVYSQNEKNTNSWDSNHRFTIPWSDLHGSSRRRYPDFMLDFFDHKNGYDVSKAAKSYSQAPNRSQIFAACRVGGEDLKIISSYFFNIDKEAFEELFHAINTESTSTGNIISLLHSYATLPTSTDMEQLKYSAKAREYLTWIARLSPDNVNKLTRLGVPENLL